MARIRYDGTVYPLVDRPTFGELEWVEKQAGQGFDVMGGMTKMAGITLISLRRAGLMLAWKDIQNISPADLEEVEEETILGELEESPTPGGAEAAPVVETPSPI
jgi:hypothetical protein